MEAITAFRELVKLSSIALATPDDCERFQHLALERPRNWRSKYPKKRKNADSLSPTTVVKWSVALQAAFERANRNGGKKCVRGVVSADRLIRENPWRMFTWIEGRKKKIRQFSGSEILSLLDYFEREWSYVPVGSLLVKMFLWSAARKSEVTSLRWDRARQIGDEYHFEFIGKWAVERWFRIPVGLFRELEAIRTASPYVFSAYNKQLRRHHERRANPTGARRIATEFAPLNLANLVLRAFEKLGGYGGRNHRQRACVPQNKPPICQDW